MDNLSGVRSDYRAFADAARDRHTWLISFLYIGTFGSFIGYAGVFPTLLKTQFPHAPLQLAFLGALVGALTRPLGGVVADRVGGARLTIASFAILTVGALGAVTALKDHSFGLFFASFMVLFTGAGIGNGATYRMIPAVFRAGVSDPATPRGSPQGGGRMHRHRGRRGRLWRLLHPARVRDGQADVRLARPRLLGVRRRLRRDGRHDVCRVRPPRQSPSPPSRSEEPRP